MANGNRSVWRISADNYIAATANINDPARLCLEYLINNGHVDIDHRARLDDIVTFVNNRGHHNFDREAFQNGPLQTLKRIGALATLPNPGPHQGGVFIPNELLEIQTVINQYKSRTRSELENLNTMSQNIDPIQSGRIQDAINAIDLI